MIIVGDNTSPLLDTTQTDGQCVYTVYIQSSTSGLAVDILRRHIHILSYTTIQKNFRKEIFPKKILRALLASG